MFHRNFLGLKNTGKIIVIAYPDTFVKHSEEWICKFLPWIGVGSRAYIKAGHAAQILIEYKTGNAFYYDFGRYTTPLGLGRVRSAITDAELEIPIKALFNEKGELQNLNDFLLWLDLNPKKTHGEGRLLASVCEDICFDKAILFIKTLQAKEIITYGAFQKKGTNCARFVTDTILASTSEKSIQNKLKFNKKFTPSTVGNVEKAATIGPIYEVSNQKISLYKGSAFKENIKNYFEKKKEAKGVLIQNQKVNNNYHKLEGVGASSYFEIVDTELPKNHFRIKRYNDYLEEDFDGVYFNQTFNPSQPFKFTYISHCAYCHVLQNGKRIKLDVVSSFVNFNKLPQLLKKRGQQ